MVGVGASRQSLGGAGSSASALDDLEEIVDGLAALVKAESPVVAIPWAQKVQRVFEAIELAKIAELKRSGASDRDTRRRASAGGTRSKKAASRASKRADAVDANPGLADDVEKGELGEEQLDAIASASAKSGGDAAVDTELIDEVKGSPADDAGKITSRWLEERNDENGTKSRYDRQRERRGVRFGFDPASGCESFTGQGDRESIEELKKAVKARADELYRLDGGRDVPAGKHPRTHAQRMFDALCQLLTGGAANAGSTAKRGSSGGSGGVRAMLHVAVTVDDAAADEIRAATVGGEGYLPASVVERYGCDAMIAGTVFGQQGEVLWHGREKRHATPAQMSALIARDGGCVMCGADPSRCEAHHLVPWNAPGRGETNVEDMALVCTDDHHWLHGEQLTLYWQLGPPDAGGERNRVWSTRSATADEVAPRKHQRAA
ncbi:MAG: DUF222 domain-containing protein [Acidimicrobiia bacterium]|nr:DUF222 domain-containing protein [Acidimicrobiia bacterium]